MNPPAASECEVLSCTTCHEETPAMNAIRTLLAFLSATSIGLGQNQLHKLRASDAATDDEFGRAVSLFGGTAIVGSSYDDANGHSKSGSAYIFHVPTGAEVWKLTAHDGNTNDRFGYSVAVHHDRALVGAIKDDDNGSSSGSAYIFDFITGAELWKLTADDGASGDFFGWSVSLFGGLALIGAPDDDAPAWRAGSGYIFDVTTGQQLLKLTAPDGAYDDELGYSVSLSGSLALMGAPFDDDNGSSSGSAYVFDSDTGAMLWKLTPDDGASGARFGQSVCLSGSLAIVGAPLGDGHGSAYIFDATTGDQLLKLSAQDPASGDLFGNSVSLSGGLALVSAIWDDDNGTNSGSSYIFDAITGDQLMKLTAQDGASDDQFGSSVSISGGKALVGANWDDDDGTDSGSAYVFGTDITPPEVNCSVGAASLWAPNHKLVDVGLDGIVVDDQDLNPIVEVLVFSDEPDEGFGDGNHDPDAVYDGESLWLRAERSGKGDGRVYLVVIMATDESGNVGYDCCTVTVAHDKSMKSRALVEAEAIDAVLECQVLGSAPSGFHALIQ